MADKNKKARKTASAENSAKANKGASEHGTMFAALKGIGMGLGITCIIFAVCALILTYTDADESFVGIVSTISTALSAAVAGFITAGSRGKSGLLTGITAGLIYGIILLAISMAAGGGPVSTTNLTTLITAAAGGGIGGILGVNTKQ